ncbi:MAG: oligosaccharide flippase family protein [Steroidobacteraceae bacterium]
MARNAFWLSFCRVAADLLSFVFFAVISRVFGPTGIGEYSYAFAIGGFVALLATSGFEEFGIRQYARLTGGSRLEAWRSMLSALAVRLVFGLAALGVFLLLSGGERARISVVVELSIFLVGWGLAHALYVPAMASQSMVTPALTELGCRTTPVIVALVLLVAATPPLPVLLAALPIGSGVLVWMALRNAARHGAPLVPSRDCSAVMSVLWGSAPFAAAETLNQFYARTDLLLIVQLLGTGYAGLYATGIKFIEVGLLPLVLIGTAAYPVLSHSAGRQGPQFEELSRDLIRTLLFLAGWLAVGIAFVVPLLIVPLFGADFAPTRAYFPWFALLALAKGGEVALYRLLYAVRRQGSYFLSLCVGTVLMVTLNFVLVPRFALLGAVIAAIVSVLTVDCICAIVLHREVSTRVLAPLLVRLGVVLAVSTSLALLVRGVGGAGWLVASAAAISYPVCAFLAGLPPHPGRSKLFLPDALRPTQ